MIIAITLLPPSRGNSTAVAQKLACYDAETGFISTVLFSRCNAKVAPGNNSRHCSMAS
jgi:hypothetical protein